MNEKAFNLVTHITVDNVDARRSMNEMKRGIRNMNQEWRANYHAQISAGHGTDALIEKSRGLKEVETGLEHTVNQLKHALNNSSDQNGNRKYKDTVLDLQRMETQLGRTKAQISNVHRAMILHNQDLRDSETVMRSHRQIGESMVNQYRNEGNELKANSQESKNYAVAVDDLNHREKVLLNTLQSARAAGINNVSNPAYSRVREQLHAVENEEVKVKNQQRDFNSGLTTTSKYNELYNQSTNKLVASLKRLKLNTEANRVEYNRLSRNLGSEQFELSRVRDNVNKVAQGSGKASIAFQREQNKLISLRTIYNEHINKVNQLRSVYDRMSSHVAIDIDHEKSKIRNLNTNSHNELQTAHALTNASIALGSAFLYGAKQSMGLENEFNKVRNLVQAGGESFHKATGEMRQMQKSATDLSMTYGQSQRTIANGFETLVRRGYSGNQALASQKYFLQGAIASGDKYNDVVHTAASTLEGFGLRTQNTAKMVNASKKSVNQLAYAADLTATDFKGLGYGMAYVAQPAHQAHQSMAETSATLGELSNQGESASQSATGLRRILINLATIKGSKNNKALKSLGLSPSQLVDAKGNLKSLTSIFELLRSKMKGMGSAQQATIFKQLFGMYGYTSAQGIMASLNQINYLKNKVSQAPHMDHGKGYASWIARKNMNSTEMQMKRLRSAGQALAITYAQGLNPVFKRFAGLALVVSKHLEHTPKWLKDFVTIGTTIVPMIVGVNYALSTFNKLRSMALNQSLRLLGIDKDEANNYQDQIKAVNGETSANKSNAQSLQEIYEQKQKNIEQDKQKTQSENDDTASTNDNSTTTKENSNVENANTQTERTNDETLEQKPGILSKVNSYESYARDSINSGLTSTATKHALKGSAGLGLIVGGTEALGGNVTGGAEDAAGTTLGGAGGAALGSITPLGPKVGEMLGQVAGPIIAHNIGKTIGGAAKSFNSWRQHNPGIRKNDEENHRIEQRIIHDQEQAQQKQHQASSSFDRDMNGMSQSSRKFVKSETSLQSKAERSYIENNNHLTKSAKNYYSQMYKMAQGYEKKQVSDKKSELKSLLKNHDISKRQYNSELGLQKSYAKKHLSQFRKDENAIMKDDTKNHKKRTKAIDKLNQQILSMTDKGTKKDKKLISDLDNRTTKLNKKSYEKTINAAMKNYTETIKMSNKTFSRKKREADREYNFALKNAKDIYGVHSRMYRQIKSSASRHKNRMIDNAKSQEKSTFKSATNQEKHVSSLAWKQSSSATKSAEREKNSQTSIFSEMASDFGSFFKGLFSFHGSRHPGGNTARANGTPDTQALHLAVGNLPGISRDENAIVNDGGGRELIKMPNGQLVLPSGRNVHTVLPKGTSVFNAIQTRRLLGAINALGNPLQHHADGTADTNTGYAGFAFGNSDDSKKGFNIDSMRGNVRDAKKAANDIHDAVDKGYADTSDAANKHLQDLHDNSDSLWKDTRKLTQKHVKNIHDDTSKRTKDLRDIIDKMEKQTESWSNAHLGTTVKYFKHHFAMIPPITSHSMKAGIRNINSGISGIDRVLSEFGGNSHVLSMVHYATGTSGPSMKKQLAVVNDATSGPTQEAIVSDTGKVRMPRGRNVLTALNPGDKVLNGTDTLRALRTGIIPHYANGLKSDDALRALAKRYAKAPASFTNNTFNKLAAVIGTVMSKGLTEATKQGSQTPANNWSNAMWKYIDTLINPDNSALLNEAHKLANGHNKYVWGASGPDAYDCGGLVMAALHHLGIAAPHTHMVNVFPKIKPSQATTGDIVESATHLGIVADPHHSTYFSAFSPHAHPNILTQPLDNAHFTPGHPYYFLRVPQLEHRNSEYQEVQHNPLTPLVKHELGSKASQWISANLSDSGGAGLAGGSGVISRAWNEFAKLGLSKNQIAAVVGGARQEAGPDFSPTAYDPDGGLGLFQITPSASGINLRSWAAERGLNWKDPAVQAKCYYEKFLEPSGFVGTQGSLSHEAYEAASVEAHSAIDGSLPANSNLSNREAGAREIANWFSKHHGKGYSTGGLSVSDKLAHISEGNKPEMVLPLTNRSRAVELMLKSLQYMFGNQTKHENSNQNNTNDQQFERELIKSNRNKDQMINKLLFQVTNLTRMSKDNINKMTILINTVRQKPVLTKADIFKANRDVSMKKMRLRNLNRGTF